MGKANTVYDKVYVYDSTVYESTVYDKVYDQLLIRPVRSQK